MRLSPLFIRVSAAFYPQILSVEVSESTNCRENRGISENRRFSVTRIYISHLLLFRNVINHLVLYIYKCKNNKSKHNTIYYIYVHLII